MVMMTRGHRLQSARAINNQTATPSRKTAIVSNCTRFKAILSLLTCTKQLDDKTRQTPHHLLITVRNNVELHVVHIVVLVVV